MLTTSFNIEKDKSVILSGAPDGHSARVLAELAARAKGRALIHIVQDDMRAAFVAQALAFFAPEVEVLSFPAWDCLPYDRISPRPEIIGQRLMVLNRLRQESKNPRIIITTVNAITQKTLPPDMLEDLHIDIAVGREIPIEKLRRLLTQHGYSQSGTVREVGEFAVRGGIVDLYPTGHDNPVRIDFFGDEVQGMRLFDPLTQMTTQKIDSFSISSISEVVLNEATIERFRAGYRELFGAVLENDPLYESITTGRKYPGVEHWLALFYPKLWSLFDYAPNALVVFEYQAEESVAQRIKQVEDFYDSRLSLYKASQRSKKSNGTESPSAVYRPAPMDGLYIRDLAGYLTDCTVARLSPFSVDGGIDMGGRVGRDFSTDKKISGDEVYGLIKSYTSDYQAHGSRVAIACYSIGSAERVAGLLRSHDVMTHAGCADARAMQGLDRKSIPLVILGLEHGFVAQGLVMISEQDILGDRLVRATHSGRRRSAAQFQLELGDLSLGDFVTHADHGIGRYEGLEAIHVLGTTHDCVKLIYDGGDKLFVPVENLDLLTRYGSGENGAVLDRLGGLAWQQRKSRVKKRLKDMAEALMKIAAERATRRGERIEISEAASQEFAARFPYNETEDQNRAIADVLADLSSGKPMDRLVCGDVGFGKTEVALRAAFAAVQAGLQVAVVVPTTLLARQHFHNFTARFKGFPYRIAQLSRMVTAGEAQQTKQDLESGRLDIVVGTHALLGKEISFTRLGLLIIDEEQHFGVKQKERMKEMRTDVHVLTLTATPIPRTLQLALSGVRELSLIASPPVDRLAVRTFVSPYDALVIREALMREHYRGGQSFYVCPRIEDLNLVAEEIRALVPEIKLVMAHGQMGADALENIMTAFDAREYDVLLATNIVESGLDIPNANTIIIHRADRFGLAQLYQLRGRVGRAKLRGYAYLTYPANVPIASNALQRLEVLQKLDELGAGFQLASHDMDIRGAGNLLGEEQSGHIREVGVELYQQMLEDAVANLRMGGDGAQDKWTPQINLAMSVLIPDDYVADLGTRLGLYRRLADIKHSEEADSMAAEMIDRFGPMPEPVKNLFETVAIKRKCLAANIVRFDAGYKGAVISFYQDKFAKPDRLIEWIGRQAGTVSVRKDQKIVVLRGWMDDAVRLAGVHKILDELAGLLG